MKQKKEEQPNEAEEYKNKYLRALADYQNLEKRHESMKVEIQRKTRNEIVSKFLSVLDHLEKAETFMKDDGLMMIANEIRTVIREVGLEELDLVGKEYDPYTAEAIDVIQGEKDNIVVDILRKGYKIDDQIIRPAQVRVSKAHVS
jgi:molecular chaperone GrpE